MSSPQRQHHFCHGGRTVYTRCQMCQAMFGRVRWLESDRKVTLAKNRHGYECFRVVNKEVTKGE